MATKYGAAIWGAGWVSGEHIRAYQHNPYCEVVAIGSRKESSARARAQETGATDAAIYTDFEQLLSDPKVDIVSICTPNDRHPAETIAAARAGKHILIEKPVALNLKDLAAMRQAVRNAGVKTVVSFVLRWNPLFECIKEMLARDTIGRVFYAEVDYWHNLGTWYKGYDWVIRKDQGGSSFLAAGCHAVDAIRWFVGKEVTEVAAFSNGIFGYEFDANTIATLKFEDGTIGKVSSSFDIQAPYQFNIDLMGEKGMIRDNRFYSKDFLPGQRGWAEIPTVLPDSGDVTHHPFHGEIAHLVECIRTDTESFVNLEDAARTHTLCFAIDRAAAEGRVVKLAEFDI